MWGILVFRIWVYGGFTCLGDGIIGDLCVRDTEIRGDLCV